MGIRFFCPNGHKLNVKEFLAGRRGICPFCGASVQIPAKSTRPSTRAKQEPQEQEQDVRVTNDLPPRPEAEVRKTPQQRPIPAETPGKAAPQAPARAKPQAQSPGDSGKPVAAAASSESPPSEKPSHPAAGVSPAEAPPTTAASQSPAGASAAPGLQAPAGISPPPFDAPPLMQSGALDPLEESPESVWYVRPESGGQFGPATADVMRSWIADGRVVAGTLVWREGWPDWQSGGDTFPQLAADAELAVLSSIGKDSGSAAGRSPSDYRPTARQHANKPNITLIVALVLAVIALSVVFLYVVI